MQDEKASVLVLDDEKNIVSVLKAILEKRDFEVEAFTDPREALNALRSRRFDAAVTDLYMPDIDGMAFLEEVKRLYPGLPVVMITAFGTVDSAVDAIKKGAFDYVTKPFEQSEIVSVLQKAVNTSRLKRLSLEQTDAPASLDPKFFGKTLKAMMESVRKASASPSTVLLLGESGSGKEFLAEEIHRGSDRSFQTILKVNCAAVSSLSLETELFGGAKPGKFELANKGTLFLDEISDCNSEVQNRLFDYLETGSFEHPLTGERKKVDVRLIVSSRKDLAKDVKEGKFRQDLFYKLNVLPLVLPPLRDRKEDIPDLVDFFLHRLNTKLGKNLSAISPACLNLFSSADWPGNLRQLESALERLMLLADGNKAKESEVLEDLRSEICTDSKGESGASFRDIVRKQTQNLEKDLIERALGEMDGNVTKTAEHLGISRKGLQLKMKELGIR